MASSISDRIRSALLKFNLAPSRSIPFIARRYPYRDAERMRQALGPDLAAETTWAATDGPLPTGDLASIFESTSDIHKWLHYLPIYDAALASYRSRPVKMLEIGVFRGGSLDMWRRFLHPDSTIVGIDIDPACVRFDNASAKVHVRIGAQQDAAFLRGVINEFGPFDVILDDGSHRTSHMVDSFRFLFPNALAPKGIYLVEDAHSNYWTSHRNSTMSFVDFTKWLIDAMHAQYQQTSGEPEFRVGAPERRTEVRVPIATVLIENIEVHDSITIVRRASGRRELPRSVMH